MSDRSELEKLVILHTNDIHSFFEHMPKIATAFRERAAAHPGANVLKLDIGDHLDRVRQETEGSEGRANLDIMNATGYEYAVLGNNEGLTFTPAWLDRIYRERAKFKIIGSNIFDTRGQVPDWMEPFAIVEKGPFRIGLIGVTASYNAFYSLLGWHVEEPLAVVKRLSRSLRPLVDVLIVMSHLGLGSDQKMAQEIPGIDCILGGHTHHLLEQPLKIGETLICAAGKFGHQIGELEFVFSPTGDTTGERRLFEVNGRTIPIQEYRNDELVLQLWHEHKRESHEALQVQMADIPHPLRNDWYRESEMGNLLAVSIREWTKSEIGIVNAGQLLHSLETGPLTKQTMLNLCPSPINPCRTMMRGADIREALEQSLLEDFQKKQIYGFGFRGKVLGCLCVDGMTIDYDRSRRPYQKITKITVNGEPFVDERMYCVGTIDMFTFGIGYLSLKDGSDTQFFLPEFIRELFIHALNEPKWFARAADKRWRRM